MFKNGNPRASDPELALAKMLVDSENQNSTVAISARVSSQFSQDQLEELRQAQECLQLLRQTRLHGDIENSETPTLQRDVSTTNDFLNASSSDDSAIFELPESIGRFRVIEEVGRGGFGVVLRARDDSLNRDVALKIPRIETLLSDESRKRFDREARAAGALSHPAIVPIYESGQIGPAAYIAFAFCEGTTLDSWIKERGNVGNDLAAKMVEKLADAISHAHSRQVIHRDIKPSNILVDAGSGIEESNFLASLRITDFGLAVLTNEDERLTIDGTLVGTPAYMPPEQAHGQGGGPAVDIYSLGVVLFQLLTGEVPFSGKSNLTILKAILEQSAPSPRKFNPTVPRDLAAICLKCLRKKPTDRYLSASDLSDDLHRFIVRQPVRAQLPSAWRKLQLWVTRNPTITVLLTLLMSSFAIGFFATRNLYRESQANLVFAETNFKEAKSTVDALLAKALSVELKAQPLVRKEMLSTAAKFYQQFIAQKQDAPNLDYDLAVANSNLAKIDREFGGYSDALEKLTEAKELFDDSVDRTSPINQRLEATSNQLNIGLMHDFLGDLKKSKQAYELAIKRLEDLKIEYPENIEVLLEYARSKKNLGAVLRQELEMEKAKLLFDQALSIRRTVADQYPEETTYQYSVAQTHSSLADWHITEKNSEKALHHANEQLAIVKRISGLQPDNLTYEIRLPNAMNRLSDVYRNRRLGDDWASQAMSWLEKAEKLQRNLVERYPLLADIHSSLVNTLVNQGDVARKNNQPELAIEKYQAAIKALRIAADLIGNNDFSNLRTTGHVMRRMGTQQELLEDFDGAITSYSRGIANYKSMQAMIAEDRSAIDGLLESYARRSKLNYSLQDFSAALKDIQSYFDLGGERWQVKVYLTRIRLWGPKMLRNANMALDITNKLQRLHPRNVQIYFLNAASYLELGQFEKAIEVCNRVTRLTKKDQAECFMRSIAHSRLGNVEQAKFELRVGDEFLSKLDGKPQQIGLEQFEMEGLQTRAEALLQD